MLYKNDEQYHLTADDIKTVRKKFRKFPVTLTYPEERVKPSPSAHNVLPDKPTSLSFPLNTTVKTASGADRWRYADNKIIGSRGEISYMPVNFFLTGTFHLQENDMELIWYLYTKCPYTEAGLNYNGRKPKCAFEDLIGLADRKALREEQAADVKALLYSSKVGLPESKLRQVAKAMFISEVDDMTYNQVKVSVEQEINRDKAKGAEKFLDMIDAEEFLDIRATLQGAIDKGLIKYVPAKNEWVWVMGPGKKHQPFAEIAPGADPNEALMDFFKGNKKFAQMLDASLKGQKVVLSGGGGSPEDDEDPDK
jgi:hypothetical protein